MNNQHVRRCAAALARNMVLCALAGISAAYAATAGDTASGGPSYQRMAPLAEYLIPDPQAEIALARSAAPASISDKATLLILKPQGYEAAVHGSNGFTCLVERSWMSPFDSTEFWNPKMSGPVCYNPAASKSILVYTLRRTKLVLAGRSKAQMLDEIHAAVTRKEIPWPEPGAMSYMMSKDGYLGDEAGHWHSHLMFHVPKVSPATWGANFPGSPVVLDDRELPEPQTVFMVPVSHWSDGTAAPVM
jgi:hypothetical protein